MNRFAFAAIFCLLSCFSALHAVLPFDGHYRSDKTAFNTDVLIEPEKEPNYFSYMAAGVSFMPDSLRDYNWKEAVVGPDISIGIRSSGHVVLDGSIGGVYTYVHNFVQTGLLYGQGNILIFPNAKGGLYFGSGATIGVVFLKGVTPWANVPMTLGYQFGEKPQFIQAQMTLTRSATINYGHSF